jgi:SAM-dependent methyltransferase
VSEEGANKKAVHGAVTAVYGEVARTREQGEEGACCRAGSNPPSDYSPEELAAVPQGAYLGEGSGAPVRYADLRPGEIVLDLGAGAGMDSFLAANAVGPEGRIYGFDLTADMLQRARRNAAEGNYRQIAFEQADIERLPLPNSAADVAISNCVINLVPDKPAVFAEIFRVLRPGGRLSIADIVLRGESTGIRAFREKSGPEAWCACVSGALSTIRTAGFTDLKIVAERPAQMQPRGNVKAVAITLTARKPSS